MIEFYERQKLSLWITIPISLLLLNSVFKTLLGQNGFSILLAIAFFLPVILLLWFFTMKTYTDLEAINIIMKPFAKKRIKYIDIKSWQVKKYRPILDYGGWGIRFGFSNSRAYNMKGNIGIQLIMVNDDRIMIGTQVTNEFSKALRNPMPNKELKQ